MKNNQDPQHLAHIQEGFAKKLGLNEEELQLILQYTHFQKLDKNQLLTAEGEIENKVYFILEGVARSYFYKNEKEISFEFCFAGQFIAAYASFFERKPATHTIETFTPIALLYLTYEDFIQMAQQFPKIERVIRLITEELFKKSSERVKDLISLSATERYEKLLSQYPQYVHHIPLKYLASYLNITPESLSRIRKNK
jgi:CRP-like cAMP-binding protein